MARFEITGPDGTKYAVEGETAEGAVAALKKMLGDQPKENVVATTPDGGRVVKGQDGALSFASPNYSTTDPAKIADYIAARTKP